MLVTSLSSFHAATDISVVSVSDQSAVVRWTVSFLLSLYVYIILAMYVYIMLSHPLPTYLA